MIENAETGLTRDAFLGGKVVLLQPQQGYRAGVDAVLLAASVPAQSGQSVLELGCGVGAAILCLGARVTGLRLSGVEREPLFADLARRNGGDTLDVIEADLGDLPLAVRQRQFDHVIANPPYFERHASVQSQDPKREAAHGEHTPLATWVRTASKRLSPKGQAHFIHLAERLPDILGAMPHDLGSVEVLPISARLGRAPDRVLVRARKNGRGAFKLHAPLVMHQGEKHLADGDSYTPQIRAVLRNGAALDF